MSEFGEWIRRKRLQQGLTQMQCAEKAGMKFQQWSRMEKQVTKPAYDTLVTVATALGLSVDEVLRAARYTIQRPEPIESRLGRRLEPLLAGMSPQKQQKVEDMVEVYVRQLADLVTAA